MELEGTLKEFPAGELIQMILYSSVTGVLIVGRGAGAGRLYSREGRLYHATFGTNQGSDAVHRMFEYPDLPFRFVAGETAEAESIYQDPWDLVAYAERRAQSWIKVRPFIPSLDCIPVLRPSSRDQRIQVSQTAWAVLGLVDGESSVDEVALRLGHVSLEVAEALVELVQQGLVTIKPPRQPVEAPAAVNQVAGLRGDTSRSGGRDTPLLQRLRAKA